AQAAVRADDAVLGGAGARTSQRVLPSRDAGAILRVDHLEPEARIGPKRRRGVAVEALGSAADVIDRERVKRSRPDDGVDRIEDRVGGGDSSVEHWRAEQAAAGRKRGRSPGAARRRDATCLTDA